MTANHIPPSYTPEEFASLSPNAQLIARIGYAMRCGDEETARELRKQVVYPAEALMVAKKTMGASWIRSEGFRTEAAEAKYGKDWLDRDV